MPFSEKIKNEVKEKSDFMCCRCKEISIHVHHIILESIGGPNTFDNAAPLCPNCHADFGDNPKKRKEIKHMRDVWYKRVKDKYSTPQSHGKLVSLAKEVTSNKGEINKLKSVLMDFISIQSKNGKIDTSEKEYWFCQVNQMIPSTSQATTSTIINLNNKNRSNKHIYSQISSSGEDASMTTWTIEDKDKFHE